MHLWALLQVCEGSIGKYIIMTAENSHPLIITNFYFRSKIYRVRTQAEQTNNGTELGNSLAFYAGQSLEWIIITVLSVFKCAFLANILWMFSSRLY